MPRLLKRSPAAGGFTLLELVVALLIAVILTHGASSHLQALGHAVALKSEINRFQRAFSLARNTAITKRRTVTLCPITHARQCSNDWSQPLAVIETALDGGHASRRVVRIFPTHPDSDITYNRGWRQVRYTPLGHTSGFNGTFYLCNGADTGRVLVLSQLGRLRVNEQRPDCF
ncbi:GspH/FimT family pseudopilin [Halomonas sp. GD1P12]|uniref:GspH/FimT family pseudopilin n=1 Tax=Halomonas sp. GD1P12 TaxID=2982691 RepID=UPI0021E424B0|nr:GspH/FimT family pseudopilin [Halomonas sp. GD1P12]UYF99396.1 GspH/FimT family pseudopilin [Halomonas sp. GD1P12]